MSELPEGVSPVDPPEPRPSASAIVLRRGAGASAPLLVVRSRKSRFMPGHLAFPGGGLDPADGPRDVAESWRLCAARELHEETGLDAAAGSWFDAGSRTTPPMFPVRFETRFYVVELDEDWTPPDEPPSAEVEGFRWVEAATIVEEWSRGKAQVPPPVLPILRTLAELETDDTAGIAEAIGRTNAQEDRAPRIEFVPGIWMVPLRTATLPPASHTNVWMPGGQTFAIIDPGATDDDEHQRLLEVIARRTALDQRPVAVMLTHEHQDHTAGAVRLARELDLPLWAHADVLAGLAGAGDCATEALGEGDVVDLSGMTLRVLATPGHAPGHLAFHVPEADAIIAGDLVGGMSTILIDPVRGDMGHYLASLARLAGSGCRTLLPGHGPPLPVRAARRLIEHRQQREERVFEQVRSGAETLVAIAGGAYPDLPDVPVALTGPQALAHLIHLEREGRVRRLDDGGERWSLGSESGGARETGAEIEQILRKTFEPTLLEIRDDSAKHVGHAGATSGGGHFHVTIESARFQGLTLLEQHRAVNEALAGLIGGRIHALGLTTRGTDASS